uniref:Wings apart-like protein C-terminal domain-containing protein n=1 Tax=Pinguiococcus pyrenoidosus TaxID=172671 RepID=A0A7R9YBW7_9STRA
MEARVHDVASRGDASRGDVLVPALEGVSMILTVIEDACAGPSVMDQPCEEQQGREAFGGGAVDLRAADAGAQNREDDPDSEGFQRQYKALRVSQAKENQSHMVAWVGDQVPRECVPVAGSGSSESSSRRRNLIAVLADFVRGCMRAICHGEDAQGAQRASWEAVGQCLAVLINLTHLNKAAGTCLTDCNGGIPTLVHLFLLLRKTRVDSSAQRFSKALGSEEAWDLEILVLSVLLNVLEYSEPARASVLRITIFEDAPSDAFREGNRPRDHPVYAQFATILIHFLTSDSETFKSEMESADMNGASSADDVLAAVGDLNGDGVHETKGQHWQRDLIVCAYYSLLLGTFFSAGVEQLEVRKTIREHLPEKSTWFPRRILKAFLAMQYHQGVVVEDIFAPVLMTIHNMEKSDAELGEAQRSDETLSADEGIHRVPMAKEAAAPCSPSASGETCHPSPSSRDLMDLSQESSSDEVDLGTRRMRSYGKGPREARRRAPVRREIKSDEETSARIGQGAEPSEDSTEGVREKGNTLAHQAVGKIRNGGAPASHGFEATVHSENHGKQPGESVAPSRRAEDAFPSPRKPARNLLKASTTKAKHIGTGVGLHRRTSAQARAMPKGKAAQAEAHGPTAAKATIIRRRLPVARLKNGAKSDATPSKVFDFDL